MFYKYFLVLLGLVVSGCANPVRGLEVVKISTITSCNESYCWSPDGGYIAFVDNESLWYMNLDGTIKRKIYSGNINFPQWSPDGQEVCFESGGNIWIHRIANDRSFQITCNGISGNPSWHPDSSKILFLKSGNIWIMDRNGHNQKEIKKVEGVTYPLFSPDGKRIGYFLSLYFMNVIDADGSNHQKFNVTTVKSNWIWSKDSKEILYCDNRGDQKQVLSCVGRVLIDENKLQIFPIVIPSEVPDTIFFPALFLAGLPDHIPSFSYSPDGKVVAITLNRDGKVNIYAIDLLQPKHILQLTHLGGDQPIWSPDGKKILFLKENQIGVVWLK
ncbi:MAG: DPP IV N-terminal domain-containing protein [Nitrospirota bacterium]